MVFNQVITNPLLSGAVEAMKANGDDKSRQVVVEEILKATFLCPCVLSSEPVQDEKGELTISDNTVVQPQMVQDKYGRPLLLAFTSQEECDKWKAETTVLNSYNFGYGFRDYVALMLQEMPNGKRGPAEGFVIDPYGCNLVVDRDMAANIMVRLIAIEQ